MSGNSLLLLRVLNWAENKKTPIPKKEVFHRGPPSSEAGTYSNEPREHILICRLTSAEKTILFDIDDDQEHLQIMENGTTHARCWIDKIKVEYEITEHAIAPWKVTIYLVECLVPLLDAEIDIVIAVSDEPPIFAVWHPAVSDEPNIDTALHSIFTDESWIHVGLGSIYSDESWIHTGLGSLYATGDIAFWVSVGYVSAT
jgi:hypothetical protein